MTISRALLVLSLTIRSRASLIPYSRCIVILLQPSSALPKKSRPTSSPTMNASGATSQAQIPVSVVAASAFGKAARKQPNSIHFLSGSTLSFDYLYPFPFFLEYLAWAAIIIIYSKVCTAEKTRS